MLTQTIQKVVIVNGTAEMLETVEAALDAGHYDIVFVESGAHAYTQIKNVQPDLVILCLRLTDYEGFRVLSMLKMDDDTRNIPVLTYTTEYECQEMLYEARVQADDDRPRAVLGLRMN
jgi:PleD family two-component response regulator